VRPGTLCRGTPVILIREVLSGPGAVATPPFLLMGALFRQLQDIRLRHIRHIEHGFRELGIEGLTTGLLPLDLLPALHGLPHRLDRGGLEDLALSKRTDHALTTRA